MAALFKRLFDKGYKGKGLNSRRLTASGCSTICLAHSGAAQSKAFKTGYLQKHCCVQLHSGCLVQAAVLLLVCPHGVAQTNI
eukprot:1160526-Pelagomonas_calceolata.AAC.16